MLLTENCEASKAPTKASAVSGLADGAMAVWRGFKRGIQRKEPMRPSVWAEHRRKVSADSGSPFPGDWSNALVPYAVEIMDAAAMEDPCEEVALPKSHQIAGTEILVNVIGYYIDQVPSPMAYAGPSLESALDFVKDKLNPTIDASPFGEAVREAKSRDEDGSTTTRKRFRGGSLRVVTASSAKGLKSYSARIVLGDEITEWPDDVDKQGDPMALLEKRTTSWERRGFKKVWCSTPGLKGTCRITAKYEASDQRRYYVPCPHCGAYQVLTWPNFKTSSEVAPYGAYFLCANPHCGGVIEHLHKEAMLAAGHWIKTYPGDDRPPLWFEPQDLAKHKARPRRGTIAGFHLWQAYSPFSSWEKIAKEWFDAKDNLGRLKDFVRQVRGEAWEEAVDVPACEELLKQREDFHLGQIPLGALFITGMADVQHNRIEYGVLAWGPGLTYWLIDKGVLLGDPAQMEVWRALDRVVAKRYPDQLGRMWPIDAFGCDAGYMTHMVYRWSTVQVGTVAKFAMDGRDGWKLPPLGSPTAKDVTWEGKKIGTAMLWPSGTWGMKSELYSSLRLTIQGGDQDGRYPIGYGHYPDACDEAYFKQLTAEHLKKGYDKFGRPVMVWVKRVKDDPNEGLDIHVGSRALAHHLSDGLTPDEWAALIAQRSAAPADAQHQLDRYWSGLLSGGGPEPAPPDLEPTPAVQEPEIDEPDHTAAQDHRGGGSTSGGLIDADRAADFMRK
ncbi:MAG: phage terminase large subunit family protein [Bacteroidota bacterium]